MFRRMIRNDKLRYLVAGAYNTVFGYANFVGLYALFSSTLHYLYILLLSHAVSVTNAYCSYRLLVFREADSGWLPFVRFNAVYVFALGFNMVALPVLVEYVDIHVLAAQALVVMLTVVGSYLLHRRFTFKIKNARRLADD